MRAFLFALFLLLYQLIEIEQSFALNDIVVLTAHQQQALGIETTPVNLLSSQPAREFIAAAIVPTRQLRIVAAPMAGLITQVDALENDVVKAGQVLAHWSSPQLAEAQRDLINAATQNKLAQDNLRRDDILFKEDIIPATRYYSTQASAAQAQANLIEKRQSLRLAGLSPTLLADLELGRAQRNDMIVTSPISGIVLTQQIDVGSRVESNTVLYKIGQLQPIWLEAQIPHGIANHLQQGHPVTLLGTAQQGRVLSIAGLIDNQQTTAVRVAVPNKDNSLKPGQHVVIRLQESIHAPTQLLQIPKESVIRQDGKPYVFLAEKAHYQAHPIQIDDEAPQHYLVRGLTLGQRVVSKGASALKSLWQDPTSGEQ